MNVKLWGGALLNYFYNNLLTHVPVHIIRLSFLRLFNKKIHSTAMILMHTRLLNFWDLQVGERVVIDHCPLIAAGIASP